MLIAFVLSSYHDVLAVIGGTELLLAPFAKTDEEQDYEEAGQDADNP
jgi:hypothetical protein